MQFLLKRLFPVKIVLVKGVIRRCQSRIGYVRQADFSSSSALVAPTHRVCQGRHPGSVSTVFEAKGKIVQDISPSLAFPLIRKHLQPCVIGSRYNQDHMYAECSSRYTLQRHYRTATMFPCQMHQLDW